MERPSLQASVFSPFLRRSLLLLPLALCCASLAAAQQRDLSEPASGPEATVDTTAQVEAAREAAQQWMDLLRAADYKQSWETTAPLFKTRVSQQQWVDACQKIQAQTGVLQSRTFSRGRYTTTLPNHPKGEYVTLFYGSVFEKTVTQEIVGMTRVQGDWKVMGYRVQPTQEQQQAP